MTARTDALIATLTQPRKAQARSVATTGGCRAKAPLPPLPAPMPSADPWAVALGELQGTLPGVARDYLAGSRLEAAGAVDGVPLYRVVCDARAAVGLTWLTTQAGPAIRRKLGSVLGMAVVVEIVVCDRPEAIVAAEVAVSA